MDQDSFKRLVEELRAHELLHGKDTQEPSQSSNGHGHVGSRGADASSEEHCRKILMKLARILPKLLRYLANAEDDREEVLCARGHHVCELLDLLLDEKVCPFSLSVFGNGCASKILPYLHSLLLVLTKRAFSGIRQRILDTFERLIAVLHMYDLHAYAHLVDDLVATASRLCSVFLSSSSRGGPEEIRFPVSLDYLCLSRVHAEKEKLSSSKAHAERGAEKSLDSATTTEPVAEPMQEEASVECEVCALMERGWSDEGSADAARALEKDRKKQLAELVAAFPRSPRSYGCASAESMTDLFDIGASVLLALSVSLEHSAQFSSPLNPLSDLRTLSKLHLAVCWPLAPTRWQAAALRLASCLARYGRVSVNSWKADAGSLLDLLSSVTSTSQRLVVHTPGDEADWLGEEVVQLLALALREDKAWDEAHLDMAIDLTLKVASAYRLLPGLWTQMFNALGLVALTLTIARRENAWGKDVWSRLLSIPELFSSARVCLDVAMFFSADASKVHDHSRHPQLSRDEHRPSRAPGDIYSNDPIAVGKLFYHEERSFEYRSPSPESLSLGRILLSVVTGSEQTSEVCKLHMLGILAMHVDIDILEHGSQELLKTMLESRMDTCASNQATDTERSTNAKSSLGSITDELSNCPSLEAALDEVLLFTEGGMSRNRISGRAHACLAAAERLLADRWPRKKADSDPALLVANTNTNLTNEEATSNMSQQVRRTFDSTLSHARRIAPMTTAMLSESFEGKVALLSLSLVGTANSAKALCLLEKLLKTGGPTSICIVHLLPVIAHRLRTVDGDLSIVLRLAELAMAQADERVQQVFVQSFRAVLCEMARAALLREAVRSTDRVYDCTVCHFPYARLMVPTSPVNRISTEIASEADSSNAELSEKLASAKNILIDLVRKFLHDFLSSRNEKRSAAVDESLLNHLPGILKHIGALCAGSLPHAVAQQPRLEFLSVSNLPSTCLTTFKRLVLWCCRLLQTTEPPGCDARLVAQVLVEGWSSGERVRGRPAVSAQSSPSTFCLAELLSDNDLEVAFKPHLREDMETDTSLLGAPETAAIKHCNEITDEVLCMGEAGEVLCGAGAETREPLVWDSRRRLSRALRRSVTERVSLLGSGFDSCSVLSSLQCFVHVVEVCGDDDEALLVWALLKLFGVWIQAEVLSTAIQGSRSSNTAADPGWSTKEVQASRSLRSVAATVVLCMTRLLRKFDTSWTAVCDKYPHVAYPAVCLPVLRNNKLRVFANVAASVEGPSARNDQRNVPVSNLAGYYQKAFVRKALPFLLPFLVLQQDFGALVRLAKLLSTGESDGGQRAERKAETEEEDEDEQYVAVANVLLNHMEHVALGILLVQADGKQTDDRVRRAWRFLLSFFQEDTSARDILEYHFAAFMRVWAWELGGGRAAEAKRAFGIVGTLMRGSKKLSEEASTEGKVRDDSASTWRSSRDTRAPGSGPAEAKEDTQGGRNTQAATDGEVSTILARKYFLLIMTDLGSKMNDREHPPAYRRRALFCVKELLPFLVGGNMPGAGDPGHGSPSEETALAPFVPKIMATLKSALQEPELQAPAMAVWNVFIPPLPATLLGPNLGAIVVSLLPLVSSSDGGASESALALLRSLLLSRREELGAWYREVPFIPQLPGLEDIRRAMDGIMGGGDRAVSSSCSSSSSVATFASSSSTAHVPQEEADSAASLVEQLRRLTTLLAHESRPVRRMALQHLSVTVQQRQSELSQLLADLEVIPPAVWQLIQALLQVSALEGPGSDMALACAETLGAIGAIDPSKVPSASSSSSSQASGGSKAAAGTDLAAAAAGAGTGGGAAAAAGVGVGGRESGTQDAETRLRAERKGREGAIDQSLSSAELAFTLLGDYLTTELRAAPDNTDNIAFAIQELLRYLASKETYSEQDREGSLGRDESAAAETPGARNTHSSGRKRQRRSMGKHDGDEDEENEDEGDDSEVEGERGGEAGELTAAASGPRPFPAWLQAELEARACFSVVEPYWYTNYSTAANPLRAGGSGEARRTNTDKSTPPLASRSTSSRKRKSPSSPESARIAAKALSRGSVAAEAGAENALKNAFPHSAKPSFPPPPSPPPPPPPPSNAMMPRQSGRERRYYASSLYARAVSFEWWVVTWCKKLISLAKGSRESILTACRGVLRSCPHIARALLPYLIRDVLRDVPSDVARAALGGPSGDKAAPSAFSNAKEISWSVAEEKVGLDGEEAEARSRFLVVLQEIMAVLAPPSGPGGAAEHRQVCSQVIFSTLDSLKDWLHNSELGGVGGGAAAARAAGSMSGSVAAASAVLRKNGASIGFAGSSDRLGKSERELLEEAQERKGVQALLSAVPSRLLASAALQTGAYARALQYFESSLRERGIELLAKSAATTSEDLRYMQLIYSRMNEPDGLVGIAVIRRQWRTEERQRKPTGSLIHKDDSPPSLTLETEQNSERETHEGRGSLAESLALLHEQIIDHENQGHWSEALVCYEQALDIVCSSSDDERNDTHRTTELGARTTERNAGFNHVNEASLHAGSLRCMLKLGHLETVVHLAHGLLAQRPCMARDVAPAAVHAAWRLGRWNLLQRILSVVGNKDEHTDAGVLRSSARAKHFDRAWRQLTTWGDQSQGRDEAIVSGQKQPLSHSSAESVLGNTEVALGRILLGIHQRSVESVTRELRNARSLLLAPLSAASMESYQRAYPLLHQLHILHEAEAGFKLILAAEAAASANRKDSEGHTESNTALEDLKVVREKLWISHCDWTQRLEYMSPDIQLREPILALRRMVLSELTLEHLVAKNWLKFASEAREAGLYQTSRRALLYAEALGDPAALLETAKLLRSQSKIHAALQLLEPVEVDAASIAASDAGGAGEVSPPSASLSPSSSSRRRSGDAASSRRALRAEMLLLATTWMVESGQRQGEEVVKRFQAVVSLRPTWDEGYFHLGKYYDFLLEAALEKAEALRKDAAREASAGDASASASVSAAAAAAPLDRERQRAIDGVRRARRRYVAAVMENYALCLRYGCKYLFQALPRLLTLWFEYSQAFLPRAAGGDAAAGMHEDATGGGGGGRKAQRSRRGEESSAGAGASIMDVDPESLSAAEVEDVKALQHMHVTIRRATSALSSYQWITALPQLASRICHQSPDVIQAVEEVMVKVLSTYPRHAMWMLLGLCRSPQTERRSRAQGIVARAQRLLRRAGKDREASAIQECSRLFDELIKLAKEVPPIRGRSRRVRTQFSRIRTSLLLPKQAGLTVRLPTTTPLPSDHQHVPFPNDQVYIDRFDDWADVMNSKEKPKRVTVRGSDGVVYSFLCKREKDGDLRKDARMMEFNSVVNRSLQRRPETRRRKLRIRTYAVICLNEECGLLEWVPHTTGFRNLITKVTRDEQGDLPPMRLTRELKETFEAMQERFANDPKAMAAYFKRHIMGMPSLQRPRFHCWFLSAFPDPSAWFEARLAFSRSCAVWSMVGYVVGLGDRHGENLLLDQKTGECVHVDFDCLFDKGLSLSRPELVPFRLTPNMMDALGPTGVEGVWRRVAEETMETLRADRETLTTVLEAFVHDPLVEWARVGWMMQQQEKQHRGALGVSGDGRGGADSRIARLIVRTTRERLRGIYNYSLRRHRRLWGHLRRKSSSALRRGQQDQDGAEDAEDRGETLPLSVQGNVHKLIQEATSMENLCQMYIGWMPFV